MASTPSALAMSSTIVLAFGTCVLIVSRLASAKKDTAESSTVDDPELQKALCQSLADEELRQQVLDQEAREMAEALRLSMESAPATAMMPPTADRANHFSEAQLETLAVALSELPPDKLSGAMELLPVPPATAGAMAEAAAAEAHCVPLQTLDDATVRELQTRVVRAHLLDKTASPPPPPPTPAAADALLVQLGADPSTLEQLQPRRREALVKLLQTQAQVLPAALGKAREVKKQVADKLAALQGQASEQVGEATTHLQHATAVVDRKLAHAVDALDEALHGNDDAGPAQPNSEPAPAPAPAAVGHDPELSAALRALDSDPMLSGPLPAPPERPACPALDPASGPEETKADADLAESTVFHDPLLTTSMDLHRVPISTFVAEPVPASDVVEEPVTPADSSVPAHELEVEVDSDGLLEEEQRLVSVAEDLGGSMPSLVDSAAASDVAASAMTEWDGQLVAAQEEEEEFDPLPPPPAVGPAAQRQSSGASSEGRTACPWVLPDASSFLAETSTALAPDGPPEPTEQFAAWPPSASFDEACSLFALLGPDPDHKLSPAAAREGLLQTQLPAAVLRDVWELADADRDGALTLEELALALHLCKLAQAGEQLPLHLPPELAPPSSTPL